MIISKGEIRVPSEKTLMEKFVTTYLTSYTTSRIPKFHREMYWMMQNPDLYPKTLTVAPRGFAKSVLWNIFDPLFDIYIRTNKQLAGEFYRKINGILIITASKDLAEHWIAEIKQQIQENPLLLEHFGDLSTEKKKNGIWTKDQILVYSSSGDKIDIRAVGRGSRFRGFHPDKIKIDDLEDDESAVSPAQCQQIESWIRGTVFGMLDKPEKTCNWIGTVIANDCVIDKAIKGDGWDSSTWFRTRYEAEDEEGHSIWPDKFPDDFLAQKRIDCGIINYAAEYLGRPLSSLNPIVRLDHIKYYEPESIPLNMYIIMAIDPALKEKEKADYTAIVLIGVCLTGNSRMKIYVLHAERGHWGTQAKSAKIFELFRRFHPDSILVETNLAQEYFRDILLMKAQDMGFYLPLIGVENKKDKGIRLNSVVHLFENGYVYFPKVEATEEGSTKSVQWLIDELISFPNCRHDDGVDAIQMCLAKANSLILGQKSKERADSEYGSNTESPIPVVGYY